MMRNSSIRSKNGNSIYLRVKIPIIVDVLIGIKAVAPASGITRQALNAGGAASGGFSTTNSLPLGGRPMRLGPANPPPPIVRRYTPVPLRSFPEEGGAVRMPMRGRSL